jgi:hypothetical protein
LRKALAVVVRLIVVGLTPAAVSVAGGSAGRRWRDWRMKLPGCERHSTMLKLKFANWLAV